MHFQLVYKVLFAAAFSVLAFMLLGCDRQTQSSASSKAEAANAVAEIASGGSAAVISGGSTASLESSPFTHPIDQEPEGKQYRIATRALDHGDFETAERIKKELLIAKPQFQPLATAIQALELVKKGKLEQALKLAEDISTLQIMQSESFVIAGEVFQIENRLSEAISALQNAIEINPQQVRAHLLIGAIYYDTGTMNLATSHLRRAAELEPLDVNALLLSAKINQDYEQYEESILDFRKALERLTTEEKKIAVRVKIAECLSKLRRLAEAREMLNGCPNTPSVLTSRASIAEADSDFTSAAQWATDALAMASDNRVAGLILGRIRLSESRWEEAKKILEPLVKAHPFDHELGLLFGRAMVGLGETEKGKLEIKRATELKNQFLEFAELHHQAMEKPEDAMLRVRLGQLAEKLGKFQLAQTWYRAALGLDADNQEAAQNLKRLNQQ